jgi:hypothetical protein
MLLDLRKHILMKDEDRFGEPQGRLGRPSGGGTRLSVGEPRRVASLRRILRRVALVSVLALGSLVSFGAPTARSQDKGDKGTVTHEFRGRLDGNFSTVTPPPLLTLADSVKGHATVLGKVTGNFTPTVDFNHPVAEGFVLVSKTGSLIATNGDQVDLAMVGTFNVATFDVHYVFIVTGGTGRFAGATGNGTYDVPPPTVFDPATGSGSGVERFRGTITLPRQD